MSLKESFARVLSHSLYTPPQVLRRLLEYRVRIIKVAYFLYFLTNWLMCVNLDERFLEVVQTALQVPLLASLVSLLVLQSYTTRHLILLGLFGALALASASCTGTKTIFWLWLLVAALRRAKLRDIAQSCFSACVVILVSVLLGWVFGLIPAVELSRASGIDRSSLGFTHPNALALLVFMLCTSWLVFRSGRTCFWDWIGSLALALISYWVSNSRTMLVVSLLFFVADYILEHNTSEKAARAFAAWGIVLFVVCAVIQIAFMVFYSPDCPFLAKVNGIFSGRLWWANYYFEKYGFSFMGAPFIDYPEMAADSSGLTGSSFVVDMAFCRLLLGYGVVPFITYLYLYIELLRKCKLEGRGGALLTGLVTFIILGMMEQQLFVPQCNIYLLSLTCLLDDTPLAVFNPPSVSSSQEANALPFCGAEDGEV